MRAMDMDAVGNDLSRLIEAGEEVVIMRAGRPVARLVPLTAATPSRRVLGRLAGRVQVPEDFDGPLSPDVLDGFEGR